MPILAIARLRMRYDIKRKTPMMGTSVRKPRYGQSRKFNAMLIASDTMIHIIDWAIQFICQFYLSSFFY